MNRGFPSLFHVKAGAVVANHDLQLVVTFFESHGNVSRPGMPRDIGQRLLHDAKARDLDVGVQGEVGAVGNKLTDEPRPLGLLVYVPAQRRGEPKVIEDRRPEIQGELAHLLQRVVHQPDRVSQSPPPGGRFRTQLYRFEIDLHCAQYLANLIVQLVGDAAPLALLRLEQLPRQ